VRSPVTARQALTVAGLAGAVAAFYLIYGNRHDYYDLKIYMSAMRWWIDGNRLYDYAQPDDLQGFLYFTYPPFAALLLWPFGHVPLGVTIAAFTIGTVVAVAVTTYWLVAPITDDKWYAVGAAVPLVFMFESIRETITFGQLNMLLIVLLLADLLFAVPRSSRWAGVGVGLATAIKLFPGIFIVYLLITRRWRAAAVAAGTAVAATLFAAAVAPRDSWQFWTESLWSTERVGRTDYTGNQSIQGLLARLVVPDQPSRLLWVLLVVAVTVFGLWRARRAALSGDELAGLTLAGLVAGLVSPITWPHHLYWFVPAVVIIIAAAAAERERRRRLTLLAFAIGLYAVSAFGVVSFIDWGTGMFRTDSVDHFLLRNAAVLLSLVLVVALPIRSRTDDALHHISTKIDRSVRTT
jgi:alpha-1,2-mannosyltransferase